jgi:hypothetical protein
MLKLTTGMLSIFVFLYQYMGILIWIKEARDIGPEIQTTQKILILEQIWI